MSKTALIAGHDSFAGQDEGNPMISSGIKPDFFLERSLVHPSRFGRKWNEKRIPEFSARNSGPSYHIKDIIL